MKERYYSESLLRSLAYEDDVNGDCDGKIDFTVIDSLSGEDVAPVVHGEWTGRLPEDNAFAEGFADWFTEEDKKAYIDTFEHTTHCSNCLGSFDDRQIREWKHCPYCGAKINRGNE